METKRKVNGGTAGAAEDLDNRALKRRKLPTDTENASEENAERTTETGLILLQSIKSLKDKRGRVVGDEFLVLPSREALPDYYEFTKMPISLETIEKRLKAQEFPNLSSLESYFKRMVQNAKEYNEKGSRIADDAERVRKAVANFMKLHNPAYKSPGYIAVPTPLTTEPSRAPSEADRGDESAAEPEDDALEEKTEGPSLKNRPKSVIRIQSQRSSATPGATDKFAGVEYKGLSFQEAQEKLILHLIKYKEQKDDDYAYFEVFVNLPPKSLKDYYQKIPNPMSLRQISMRILGNHGRGGTTGVSDFKSWAALEEEISIIWKNARFYNEDGSDIYNLAIQLERLFYKALREAKQAVPDPAPVPKIKLKMQAAATEPTPQPKIMLKVPARVSPSESPVPQTNGSRGDASTGVRRNPFGDVASGAPNLMSIDRARSISVSAASPTRSTPAIIKNEEGTRNSPATTPSTVHPHAGQRIPSQPAPTSNLNGMPPPAFTAANLQNSYSANGYAQSFSHSSVHISPNSYMESKLRPVGKGVSDALISNLSLATHPGLNISRHFRLDLPPSPTLTHQSITVNLPSTHYYLQIKPTIPKLLVDRQYKLFVTSGIQRLHAMPLIPGHAVDQRHPLFEARLVPGVNRIEIELIASLPKGTAKPLNGQDVELEKITVFVNLMRW